jgi:leader peptidase (prepilin peptidase)/N-methyltransferase
VYLPTVDPVLTPVAAVLAAALGAVAGAGVNRAAGRFPWPAGSGLLGVLRSGAGAVAVRRPVLEVGTALLLALVVLRFGLTWQLPAFLLLALAGVLLAVVDLQHQLLPNRVVRPALVGGALLLLAAAAATGAWGDLARAMLGAVALFAAFLALALVSPGGLGMGDVKLAALLGLYLGWLGWGAVLAGGVASFLVQAAVAVALLAARRVRRDSELPFGPAMLVGAALVMALPSP